MTIFSKGCDPPRLMGNFGGPGELCSEVFLSAAYLFTPVSMVLCSKDNEQIQSPENDPHWFDFYGVSLHSHLNFCRSPNQEPALRDTKRLLEKNPEFERKSGV